jgi:hypothetical protein
MIFNENILHKFLNYRNLNIMIHGSNIDILNTLTTTLDKKQYNTIDYKQLNDTYLINNTISNKKNIITLITEISLAPNFYSETIRKKVIILLNIQNLNKGNILKLKRIIESSFESACFLLHIDNVNNIDKSMKSHFLIVSLPIKKINDDTISITYNRFMKLVKEPLTKKTIETIREICYMYYMNHSSSVELQRYIVKHIGKILVLPNEIKHTIVKDIVTINNMYSYSYRKPLYLECIIYSLFKHLEHYTI